MTKSNEPYSVDDVEPMPEGSGFSVETSDYEFAIYLVLRDIDVEAQLRAISDLLRRQQKTEQSLSVQIKEASEIAKRTHGFLNEQAIDDYITHLHESTYQDAAHSMAAVGMLAPLIESIFHQSFDGLRHNFLEHSKVPLNPHPRWEWSGAAQWDCHFVWSAKGSRRDLVAGIVQLAQAIGLFPHLPPDLTQTLQALFAYRNRMFHNGFEWPFVERERFQQRIRDWPANWFAVATSDNRPWIFYLTDTFIQHCLTTIDSVLSSVGGFARKVRLPDA
jgi:hypothetical protein